MSIKRRLLLSALILGLAGCGWLHDRNPPAGPLSLNMGRYSCMSEIGQKVTNYLNGKLNADEVKAFGGCIRTALNRFMIFTSDRRKGEYNPKDLQRFLNIHYLSSNQQMSDQFTQDIMDLKVVIVGGSRALITDSEITKMIDLVTLLQSEAIANLPYVQLYSHVNDKDFSVDRATLDQARIQLQQSARDIANLLQGNDQPYRLDSLERLIGDAQAFLNWKKLHPKSMSPQVFTQLVQAHRYVVTGTFSNEIEPADWPVLFDSITAVYSAIVNYKAIRHGPYTYGPNLDILIATVRNIFDLIGRTIDHLPNNVITFDSTDRLLAALGAADYLNGLRVKSIDDVYRYAVAKALRDPTTQSKGLVVTGLSRSQLGQLQNEFDLWADTQSYLSDRAKESLGFSSKALLDPKTLKSFETKVNDFDLSPFIFNYADPRGQEIQKIIENIPPFFKDGRQVVDNGDNHKHIDRRAYIMPRGYLSQYGVKYGMTDLTYMNIIHSLARLLVRGFASDDRIAALNGDWTKTGVTESEMEMFYNTVHGLGQDLQFMYPKYGSGSKSFIEGKLFTYAGDGIDWPGDHKAHRLFNFDQIMEYITELWSGGQVRNQIYNEMFVTCWQDGDKNEKIDVSKLPKDVFNIPVIPRACFAKHFFDHHLDEFANLPGLQQAFSRLSLRDQNNVVYNLEDIARYPCNSSKKYIEFSEIATIATVLHYVETIFTVYDRDQNGVLDQYEIMNAFNRFHGYLARQVQVELQKKPIIILGHKFDPLNLSTDTLESIFAFLIQYQRSPTAVIDLPPVYWNNFWYFNRGVQSARAGIRDILQKMIYWHKFSTQQDLPRMSIDRAGILNVLTVLAESSNAAYVCRPKNSAKP